MNPWPPSNVRKPSRPVRVTVVLGTRPEAIKMSPVVRELRRCPGLDCTVVSTGQHREMLASVFEQFDVRPDIELDLMTEGQSLNGLTRRILKGVDRTFDGLKPDLCLVHGDTTTALAGALAAFYRRIPIGHVEAGLRTYDMQNPFCEEGNRRLIAPLAEIHFAPTANAWRNLLQENVSAKRVVVTGNTVVDALHLLVTEPAARPRTESAALLDALLRRVPADRRMVLVTAHRRESWGRRMADVCSAIRELAQRYEDVCFVFPVHLNPRVWETVEAVLAGRRRVHLLPPLEYADFVRLMKRSHLVLTDSGGVQEEAPTFGKPVLLMREATERPEAFTAGAAKVVGTGRQAVVREVSRLLDDSTAYRDMVAAGNPYGDGRAAERIVRAIRRWHRLADPWLPLHEEFNPQVLPARPERVAA
jgi:UDP-N-acetylglucosamine 2-epimerase (non-hydrolysing)